jgi:hypothetical protein
MSVDLAGRVVPVVRLASVRRFPEQLSEAH